MRTLFFIYSFFFRVDPRHTLKIVSDSKTKYAHHFDFIYIYIGNHKFKI